MPSWARVARSDPTGSRQSRAAFPFPPPATVSQGADSKGKLKITEFDKPELLTQISGRLLSRRTIPTLHALTSASTMRQGYLEASNTSVVTEMANMMTAMRVFEANQHIIQIQDDRMGKVISDLGNPGSS